MTGDTTSGGIGQAGALACNLVALIDAVAGLRQAQANAAQAAAARAAAEQLHAALSAARIRVTQPGQTPARSARHAAATADFPLPPADILATAVSTDSAEQRSTPQVAQPPARARPARQHPADCAPTDCPRGQFWPGDVAHTGRSSSLHCGRPPGPTLPRRQSRQAGGLVTEREPVEGPR